MPCICRKIRARGSSTPAAARRLAAANRSTSRTVSRQGGGSIGADHVSLSAPTPAHHQHHFLFVRCRSVSGSCVSVAVWLHTGRPTTDTTWTTSCRVGARDVSPHSHGLVTAVQGTCSHSARHRAHTRTLSVCPRAGLVIRHCHPRASRHTRTVARTVHGLGFAWAAQRRAGARRRALTSHSSLLRDELAKCPDGQKKPLLAKAAISLVTPCFFMIRVC